MERVAPTGDVGRLLRRIREAGVVLDFMMLEATDDVGGEGQHREVAITFLQSISAEFGLSQAIRPPGPSGRRISVDDFYGWHFDHDARRLRVAARGPYVDAWQELYRSQHGTKGSLSHELGYGPYRWCDDADPNNAIWTREEIACAYGHAFLDPPYSVRVAPSELQELYLAVDDQVLQRPDEDTEIWWWDGGDWADYSCRVSNGGGHGFAPFAQLQAVSSRSERRARIELDCMASLRR